MGSFWSCITEQTKRIIYVQDENNRNFPLVWSKSYYDLLLHLKTTFNYVPYNDMLVVDDAADIEMCVKSQETFDALLPKYKKMEPNLNVFYINIDLSTKKN
jgi:hypothetical protein